MDQSTPTGQQPQAEHKSKTPIWIALSIILTALIVGGGVFAWQSMVISNTESDLQDKITSLESQIATLEAQMEEDSAAESDAECQTSAGKDGFIMDDGKCYAPGQTIPDTDCTITEDGECAPLDGSSSSSSSTSLAADCDFPDSDQGEIPSVTFVPTGSNAASFDAFTATACGYLSTEENQSSLGDVTTKVTNAYLVLEDDINGEFIDFVESLKILVKTIDGKPAIGIGCYEQGDLQPVDAIDTSDSLGNQTILALDDTIDGASVGIFRLTLKEVDGSDNPCDSYVTTIRHYTGKTF